MVVIYFLVSPTLWKLFKGKYYIPVGNEHLFPIATNHSPVFSALIFPENVEAMWFVRMNPKPQI